MAEWRPLDTQERPKTAALANRPGASSPRHPWSLSPHGNGDPYDPNFLRGSPTDADKAVDDASPPGTRGSRGAVGGHRRASISYDEDIGDYFDEDAATARSSPEPQQQGSTGGGIISEQSEEPAAVIGSNVVLGAVWRKSDDGPGGLGLEDLATRAPPEPGSKRWQDVSGSSPQNTGAFPYNR